jgi:putative oxidoreductase
MTDNTMTPSMIDKASCIITSVYSKIDLAAPIANLTIRLWVANVFFKSGMLKLNSWDSTMYLFENEYDVPLLPSEFAAMLGTAVELIFPILLVFGLAGRFGAFVLFMFNILAVVSYPDLNAAGIRDHQVWGIMLLVPFLYGPGKISIDHFIKKKFGA